MPRPSAGCNKTIDANGPIGGVTALATQDNGICTSADIDNYSGEDGRDYVAQAGGEEAGFVITDVTDPANPVRYGPFTWSGRGGKNTYTPDVKAFKQIDPDTNISHDYLALSLERMTVTGYCGVAIVDVTDPTLSSLPVVSQATGADWCDVHNTFVEKDSTGLGRYIYLTADGPNDMRVLAIDGTDDSSVVNPVEIGRYAAPGRNNSNYVHDITVIDHGSIGRRAYLAYWASGTVVLNAGDVTPGYSAIPIVGPNVLDPAGFLSHHAWASDDGSSVFIQDEFLDTAGDQPVQMWNVSSCTDILPCDGTGSAPVYIDGLTLGTDVPVNPAHNLEMRSSIAPNRLYIGWYKLGFQAWDFDANGFVGNTAVEHHQVQTEGSDDSYDGTWGVRLDPLDDTTYLIYQSDRRYGLVIDCAGDNCPVSEPPPPPPSGGTGAIKGTVSDAASGARLFGVLVAVDTGETANTNKGGKFSIGSVPSGGRTVTATLAGYQTQILAVNIENGQTKTLNINLVANPN